MGIVVAIAVTVVGLVFGIYGVRSLREMMRRGRSYMLLDWRRLFEKGTEYDRQEQATPFWIAIFINSFLTTIALCFPIIAVVMLVIAAAAIFFGRS